MEAYLCLKTHPCQWLPLLAITMLSATRAYAQMRLSPKPLDCYPEPILTRSEPFSVIVDAHQFQAQS